MDRGKEKIRLVFGIILLLTVATIAAKAAPTIVVWSGLNQSYGQIGNPQRAINILGNVSDPNGVDELYYALNGGSAIPLSKGPDTRRLLSQGDFNIDIELTSLLPGANEVVITAINGLDETSSATVNVNYTAGNVWPIPYVVDWNSASSIESVAQIVDGHWTLSGGSISPTQLGYDRLVAIGDTSWSDYEVTVPITIHGIDPAGYAFPSLGPGVGLILRWEGHTDYPISGMQPKTGYLPLGAIAWFYWDDENNQSSVHLHMLGNELGYLGDANVTPIFGTTYNFKMRVETVTGQGSRYNLKVWEASQAEPSGWTIESSIQPLTDPQNGCVLLVSHHVDVDFGNVVITDLSGIVPVQLSSFTAVLQEGNLVRLDWTTISETNNFGFEVQKSASRPENFATIPNSFIPGHGTTLEPRHYSFVDSTSSYGNWYYRLKQIDLDGTFHFTDPVYISVVTSVAENTIPQTVQLLQNYPNPFNPSTIITYEIPVESRVRLEVFNVLGQRVALLADKMVAQGRHSVEFNASSMTSGVYIYRMTTGAATLSRRMMLVK